jgi:phosphate uptake regulator
MTRDLRFLIAAMHIASHLDPAVIAECTHLVRATANLEQIADLAVAIAEEGLFVQSGHTGRHHHNEIFPHPA